MKQINFFRDFLYKMSPPLRSVTFLAFSLEIVTIPWEDSYSGCLNLSKMNASGGVGAGSCYVLLSRHSVTLLLYIKNSSCCWR